MTAEMIEDLMNYLRVVEGAVIITSFSIDGAVGYIDINDKWHFEKVADVLVQMRNFHDANS